MRHNSVVIDSTHGLIHFPHVTLKVKNTATVIETSGFPQSFFTGDNLTIPPMTTKASTAFVDH